MKLSSFWIGLLLLGLTAGTSLADDKIFHLKNGRKIEGELVDETPTAYIVKTSGGKTTLPKDLVKSIETAPEPKKQFLDPDPEQKKPDADTPANPDTPSGTTPKGTTPSSTPSGPRVDIPTVQSGSPLASDSDIADMRKALLAVPSGAGDDPATGPAARESAINAIVKKTNALATLVAIIAEPINAAHPQTPPERVTALEIVRNKFPSESVRPFVAQAIAAINLESGAPKDLLNLIFTIGDGDDGAIGTALVAKTAEVIGKGQSPDSILEPLEKVAQPEKHLAPLFKLLLTPDRANAGASLGAILKKIVLVQRDREAAMRLIAPLIDPFKLPPYDRLAPALDVFACSRSRDGAEPVGRILDVLERTENVPAAQKNAFAVCLRNAYGALVQIWCPESRDRIVRALDNARTPEQRIMILDGFRAIRPGLYPVERDFCATMIEKMADSTLSENEVRAFAEALHVMTNRQMGNDPSAWQTYLDTLPR